MSRSYIKVYFEDDIPEDRLDYLTGDIQAQFDGTEWETEVVYSFEGDE